MKRIISMLLVLAMLLSATLMAVSCSKEEKKTPQKSTGIKNTGPAVEGDIFAERAAIDDELPDADFGGKRKTENRVTLSQMQNTKETRL